MRRSILTMVGWCLGLGLTCPSLPGGDCLHSAAMAQPAPADKPTARDRSKRRNDEPRRSQGSSKYTDLIDRALMEYRMGHFAEARTLFVEAHAVSPNARTLRGLGMADFELRDYVDAKAHLEAALRSKVKPLKGRLRRSTEALLDQAEAYVGTLEVSVLPSHAEVTIDSVRLPDDAAQPFQLDVGQHDVSASAAGYVTKTHKVHIKGRSRSILRIQLEAMPLRATESRPNLRLTDSAAPRPPREDDGSLLENPWIWVGAAAVVAIAAGTVLVVRSGSDAPSPYGGTAGTSLTGP